MPSLHFATSLMAARVPAEGGRRESAVAWAYALTRGFSLVYLGAPRVALPAAAFTTSVARPEAAGHERRGHR